jgi:hypothetical protein
MKPVPLLVVLAILVGLPGDVASEEALWGRGVRIGITECGYPWIPSQSQLDLSLPGSVFFRDGLPSRLGLDLWYLTASPLFLPEPFFEVGLLLDCVLREGRVYLLRAGAGSAYSRVLDVVSVPLILRAKAGYFPWRWLAAELTAAGLLYGEGFILDGALALSFRPFGFGLLLSLGAGTSVGYSWTLGASGWSWRLSTGVGYLFKGR